MLGLIAAMIQATGLTMSSNSLRRAGNSSGLKGSYFEIDQRRLPREYLLTQNITEEIWSGRRGSNSQLSAWEGKYSALYFQHLQNRSRKISVHAAHTVHAF